MERSESIKEIATALCKFQRDVETIKKKATNPFFKSKYASLSDILDVIRIPLAEVGLSFVQFPADNHGLTTMLMHTSGEWISETYFMKPTKDDPQGAGSVITYQRRYALGAILGLNIDEDDDANKASAPVKETKKEEPVKVALTPKHPKWGAVVDYLRTPEGKMTDILKKYFVSKEIEKQLMEEVMQSV